MTGQKLRAAYRCRIFQQLGRLHVTIAVLAVLLIPAFEARAEDPVWTTGRVIGSDGRPVVGAIVAAYDDSNKVVDYAHTDRNG